MTTEATLIVAGDDGSSQAGGAVHWAARHASTSHGVLRLVHVVHVPVMTGLGWRVDAAFEAGRLLHAAKAAGEDLLARRRRSILDLHPDLPVECVLVEGDPGLVLVQQARPADLLVVGSRGHGLLRGMLLGSVSRYVAGHATCPAVIFQQPDEAAHLAILLSRVGDDPAAVDFAAAYADTHGLPLVVRRESGGSHERGRADDAWREVEAALADFRRRHPHQEIRMEEVEQIDVARATSVVSAELVVIERRHHAHLALDSAVAAAEHSRCPVAIVPDRTTAAEVRRDERAHV